MEDRIRHIERSLRALTLAVVALVVLQAWSVLRPAQSTPPATLLPAANANTMEVRKTPDERPGYVLTTSQSGATLYEWIWDAEQQVWAKRGF